jgi:mycofactocin system glycosyltransferase
MAHPRPSDTPGPAAALSLSVAIPVRDRCDELDECLTALGRDLPVVVVDDGSADGEAVEVVARRHGARVLTRPRSGGPGAARNDALQAADTDVVAFVDSDCLVRPRDLATLLPYFDDPAIGAVAPRVRPRHGDGTSGRPEGTPSLLERFGAARSSLDMGADEGPVGPDRAVRYVPAAALLVRRRACGSGFDARLRVGEDVDFVWRLADRGWDVRYVPSVVVHHREPRRWRALLARRARYGTSAGPLARRHGSRLAPADVHAAPAVVLASAARGRIGWGLATWTATGALALRRLAGTPVPPATVLRWQVAAPWWTLLGLARGASTVVLPGLPLVMLVRRGRRLPAALLLLGLPALVEWWQRRPDVDPARWTAACLADDLAYGMGVWAGCIRARTLRPLLPVVRLPAPARWRPRHAG